MVIYDGLTDMDVKSLFSKIAKVAAQSNVQSTLKKLQKNLDTNYTDITERRGARPFKSVSEKYFQLVGNAFPDQKKAQTVYDAFFVIKKTSDTLSGAAIKNMYSDFGYARLSLTPDNAAAFKQGQLQIETLANYYLLKLNETADGLIVFNVLGNNSREGSSLSISVHKKMVELILYNGETDANQKGLLLVDMLKRTVFLNTGAAGKGVTLNQIKGWAIFPNGQDLQALKNLIFDEISPGVFKPKLNTDDGFLLTQEICNLKQFNVKSARLYISRIELSDDYRATMKTEDGQTVIIEDLPIRAAGKVSAGIPGILIGGTEAEANTKYVRQYFSDLGKTLLKASQDKQICIPKNSLQKQFVLNPPILMELNSTNTGENILMGKDKLVQYLLMNQAIKQSGKVLEDLTEALKKCEESSISLRALLYPKENEKVLARQIKQQLNVGVCNNIDIFAVMHMDAVTVALSESHFASSQSGPQSARAGGTLLQQLTNALDSDMPAFRSSSMLLSMFDPKFMSHMSDVQASFELIAYVKEFWQALTYLVQDNRFYIADMPTSQEFIHWMKITVDIYNSVLSPSAPISHQDIFEQKLEDVNRFFGAIWAKFEPAIPKFTADEKQQIADSLRVYAVPVVKEKMKL